MNRNRILMIGILVALFVAIVAAVLLVVLPTKWSSDDHATNDVYYYEDGAPTADPAIVGMWRNAANPQWYKVYYDDYHGDGYFWGKEWDEADDVEEEDLTYHGNGWFMWRKEGKNLRELHKMDLGDAVIPKFWRFQTKQDSLLLFNPDNKRICDRFGKVEN